MIRKVFGWILIILGLFCVLGVFASMSVNGAGLDSIPYMLIWVYILAFGGYRLIAIPKENDVIAIWKKIFVYFAVAIVCAFIGAIIGTLCNDNTTLMGWIFITSFIIMVESDIVKKWMLNIYYRKHPEKAPESTCLEEDSINTIEPSILESSSSELELGSSMTKTISRGKDIESRETLINENVMKSKFTFQQKVNITLLILSGVFLITSIVFFLLFAYELFDDDDFCLAWLIFSLLSAIPRLLWWYFNHNQLTIEENKKYGLAFLISGFVLCISPFYAVVSLFLGGVFTKQVFDKLPR